LPPGVIAIATVHFFKVDNIVSDYFFLLAAGTLHKYLLVVGVRRYNLARTHGVQKHIVIVDNKCALTVNRVLDTATLTHVF
jgi:hypothetical protein